MYTIKQAAIRTGLPIPTIRAWERRYGVIRSRADRERLPPVRRRGDRAARRDAPARRGRRDAAEPGRGPGACRRCRPSRASRTRARRALVDDRRRPWRASAGGGHGHAVVRRGHPRRDPSDGHRRDRTAPRRGLRGGALRGGDEQRRLPGAARHRRGLGGGHHRRRHGARGQRDHPATAGPVLRRGRRPLVAARRHRRVAAGLPARDRRDGVRGRRPPRRPQRPLPRRERAGAQLGPDRRCGRRARRGRRGDRRSRRAGGDGRGHVAARVDEPAGRLRRRSGGAGRRRRDRRRRRCRPSWMRPSRSCASACARAARPDRPPDTRRAPAARHPIADGTLRPMETSS